MLAFLKENSLVSFPAEKNKLVFYFNKNNNKKKKKKTKKQQQQKNRDILFF